MPMLSRAILAGVLTCTTTAHAAPLDPPARYDYPPTNLVGVWEMSQRELTTACREAYPGYYIGPRVEGCTYFTDDNGCVVMVLVTSPYLARLIRHEKAHCNGWVHGWLKIMLDYVRLV